MPWYAIALLVCIVIGPFDALYLYIRAQRRREELKRREEKPGESAEDGEGHRKP